jgi:monoamine oxidase
VKYSSEEGVDAADIFDYVICTLPLSVLRTIEIRPYFTNRKMQAIKEFHYIDAQKTLFLCSKRFWERNTDYGAMFGGISFTDLPIQSIIYPGDHNHCITTASGTAGDTGQDNSASCSSEVPGVLTASYNLEQNSVRVGSLEEQNRFDLIRQNVEEVHGLPRGFLNSIVEHSATAHWNSAPHFLGALSYALPGQKQLFSYDLLQPEYQGRVYLAGEHASAKHGWMQGALYSGKDAANRLAQHFHTQYVNNEVQEFAAAGKRS